MTFVHSQEDEDVVRQAVEDQFPGADQDEVFALIAPFLIQGGSRVPLCILKLAKGDKAKVARYAADAHRDWRDVIYWAEYPEDAALDTPEKVEAIQKLLEWAGQPRSAKLEQMKQDLLAERERQKKNRTADDA